MRKLLDGFYAVTGALAALLIVAICGIVLVQVTFNVIDKIAVAVGLRAFGLVVPSYAEFTGFFLVGATFFALANTLQKGAHIRVTLFTQKMSDRWSGIAEVWAYGAGTLMAGYFAYWAFNLVFQSWTFHDLSPGIVAIPIWLPQLPMALGLVGLTVCLIDQFVQAIGRLSDCPTPESPTAVQEEPNGSAIR